MSLERRSIVGLGEGQIFLEGGEGLGDGALADGLAVSSEVNFLGFDAGGGGEGDVDEAAGFFSVWFDEGFGSGDAGDAEAVGCAEGVFGAEGHFFGGFFADGAVGFDGFGVDTSEGDFGGGGVGDESAEEGIGGAIDGGEGGAEEAAGAGFGDGEGLRPFGQDFEDEGFEGFFAFGVDVAGDAGIDLVGDGGEEGMGFFVGDGAGGEAEVDFAGFGVGGDGDLGEVEEVLEAVFEGGFADADDAEDAGDEAGAVAEFEQGLFDGAVEHGEEFVGGAGEADDDFAVFSGDEAGGGSVGVFDWFGAGGALGLAVLVGGEGDAAGAHEGFEAPFDFGVFDEGVLEGGGDGVAGEVVLGGAESADGEDDVGAGEGEAEGFDGAGEVIADGLAVQVVDADFGEESADGGGVGIDGLAEEELGADGDDLGLHSFILAESSGVVFGAGSVSAGGGSAAT